MGRKLKTIHNALLPIAPNHSSEPKEGLREGSTVYVKNFGLGHPFKAKNGFNYMRSLWHPALGFFTEIKGKIRTPTFLAGADELLSLKIPLDMFNMPKPLAL